MSTRVRTVASAEARAAINEIVVEEFAPEVQRLDGYRGYLLADVVENDAQSLSVVMLAEAANAGAFGDLAADFVDDLGELAASIETRQWEGNLLIAPHPVEAKPGPVMRDGHVVLRVYRVAAGSDPMDTVATRIADVAARIETANGFRGALWYLTAAEVVSISLFDSASSAEASGNEGEALAELTTDEPEVFNGAVVWAELPVLTR